ncbi:hypothetical protein AQZ52_15600 [Novosphingobium fuchskuhlense]|uniref:17 kDa surface antigen n=1 Tax=Novosphingobium fuchskuhlense TaxID=1117702 RepID=A0A124JTJ9_9SPHN|nr:hypothetical protein [Novosphingobium fuchskuhlense]KUR70277.1 hypothetical protein AQZ52_15600 [Novosphingobium fuchskuhlense]
MFTFAKKATLALALGATALASATPAMADPYYGGGYGSYRHHGRGGDGTGAAIAGGIIGLALGAIIASAANSNHNRDRYDSRYRGQYQQPYRGQPTWQGAQNGDPYDQRYQGGQPGYSRDGYPETQDGYYDRRGYRDPDGYQGDYRGN